MKTNQNKNASELKSRPEQLGTKGNNGKQGKGEAKRLYVNFKERETNRNLPTERVMALMNRWMPKQHKLAKVIGQWIWIRFPEAPEEEVRRELSQLGFHWNRKRQAWQHPCGTQAEHKAEAV
jgi:hypothetical protein